MPDYLTVKDVVRVTGLHEQTIHGHIRRGNLPFIKFGSVCAIKKSDFERFLLDRAQGRFTR
jgi:excisionase family DNA binding protein